MKRKLSLFALLIAGVLGAGCVMVIGVHDNDFDPPCRKRIVYIDGEAYVADLKHHRIRKAEDCDLTETTTTTTTTPPDSGK